MNPLCAGGLLLSAWIPAHAQSATPDLLGVRVALLSASSDPAFPVDVRDTVMAQSRGVGAVVQQLVIEDGVSTFRANPLESRVAYEIARIDVFDVAVDVPSLADLDPYDAIVVHNDVAFVSADAVGDLAAFAAETGRAVILTGAALDGALGIRGRFETQNLAPSTWGTLTSGGAGLAIVPVDATIGWGSDLDDGVLDGPNVGSLVDWGTQQLGDDEARVRGGAAGQHLTGLVLREQAEVVHQWSDGEPATVFLAPFVPGGGAIALANVDPVSDATDPLGWDRQTSGGRLLANVILEAVRLSTPDPGPDAVDRPTGHCEVPGGPFMVEPLVGTHDGVELTTCDYVSSVIDGTPQGTFVRCASDADCLELTGDVTATCAIASNRHLEQDLNCNGIDVADEPRFDPLAPDAPPDCATNLDPSTFMPWDTVDAYFDYESNGCTYLIARFDWDGDGLSFGSITLQGGTTVDLQCDNCPDHFNPAQLDWDGDGVGDVCDSCPYVPQDPAIPGLSEDPDGDGFGNACDNCPLVANADQIDDDNDGYGDACDSCPAVFGNRCGVDPSAPDHLLQEDTDADGAGDVCDNCRIRDVDGDDIDESPYAYLNDPSSPFYQSPEQIDVPNPAQDDTDGDGWGDACDVCPETVDPDQGDADFDGVGDACDSCPGIATAIRSDGDRDGRGDFCDNCPDLSNPDQFDLDFDGIGDACDNCVSVANDDQSDQDQDGIGDFCDTCRFVPNPDQSDQDLDGIGDACDNCPLTFGSDQDDRDGDGFGDACDACIDVPTTNNLDSDGDGRGDGCDNCTLVANFDQSDRDGDGLGDACDAEPDGLPGGCGGGCSQSGPSGVALVGLLAALVGRRRRVL